MVLLCRGPFPRAVNLLKRTAIASPVPSSSVGIPVLNTAACCIIRETHPGFNASGIFVSPLYRFYRSTFRRARSGEKVPNRKTDENSSENIDDLKSLLQDKSMSLTAKFKVLFQQYGVVLVVVHLITVVFWMGIFYVAVSRGFDIIPFLEEHGVFDFLERVGLPASEKLKSPGASNLLAAYLLYEVAKPIRYPVTIVGTIYAVRFLRRFKYLKRPPTSDATVREVVETQGKIVRHHLKSTATKYRDFAPRLRRQGKRSGPLRKNGRKH